MGCGNSKQESGTVTEIFVKSGGLMPASNEYQNEFEKQIFMAINNCRTNPKRFVTIVRDTAATHVLAKSVPEDTVKNLLAYL